MKRFHILQYVKYRALAFLLYGIVLVTFPVIQYLYWQKMEAVWYAIEVVSVIFGIAILLDYIFLIRKHRNLKKVYDNLTVYETQFPKARNIIEEDYAAIMKLLYKKSGDSAGELESKFGEQIDYYTMWVHQIKTPISALSLLLQDSSMPQDTRNAMEQEVFKIEQYASMVLEYLRIENMNSDLILRPCLLSEVTRKAVKKYATIFIHKRISLDMQELTSKVLTDDKWLSFVIEQLLSNALKYTAKGT
ncbi:MAG TPA: sensor histidine kinase, partial [Lachnospiraceae bacterium]|nr:sensor histidine kinase [Lachnospiraceae bacterium]